VDEDVSAITQFINESTDVVCLNYYGIDTEYQVICPDMIAQEFSTVVDMYGINDKKYILQNVVILPVQFAIAQTPYKRNLLYQFLQLGMNNIIPSSISAFFVLLIGPKLKWIH